jgi:putative transposase
MAWTETARRQYCRDELHYASNLTDAEWALIAPFMPAAAPRGRPRSVSLRVIVEAIFYMLSTGCQWRQIPREFAPFTTDSHPDRRAIITRKNFLFLGSDAGGERAAVIYTMLQSARLNGLDPDRVIC